MIGGKKSYLFAFIDDHSRAVMGARSGSHEDTWSGWPRRSARRWQARGVPQAAYVDNGSPFVDAWLLRGLRRRWASGSSTRRARETPLNRPIS